MGRRLSHIQGIIDAHSAKAWDPDGWQDHLCVQEDEQAGRKRLEAK